MTSLNALVEQTVEQERPHILAISRDITTLAAIDANIQAALTDGESVSGDQYVKAILPRIRQEIAKVPADLHFFVGFREAWENYVIRMEKAVAEHRRLNR